VEGTGTAGLLSTEVPPGISVEEWRMTLAALTSGFVRLRNRRVDTPLNRSVRVARNASSHLILVTVAQPADAGGGGPDGLFGGDADLSAEASHINQNALIRQFLRTGEELWFMSTNALQTFSIVSEVTL
jgi:hypothetical protein